ncbi:MAG TPA: hypothetical protein VM490_11105 [Armatimonadaceae bacterium]|nr:hypothetical protein [Armatimonadaceae bacterium]
MNHSVEDWMFVQETGPVWLAATDYGDITYLLGVATEFFRARPFALMASMDGGRGDGLVTIHERHLALIAAGFERAPETPMVVVDNCVLMSGSDFVRLALDDGGLSYYDEVWFYDELPAAGVPDGVNITGLGPYRLTDADDAERQKAAIDWFAASGCRMAVGDGSGLNMIFRSVDDLLHVCGREMLAHQSLTIRNLTITDPRS